MFAWRRESDKSLEEGVLKGSLLHTGGHVLQLEEGSVHTYIAGGEIIQEILAAYAFISRLAIS